MPFDNYNDIDVLDRINEWLNTDKAVDDFANFKGIPVDTFTRWIDGSSRPAVHEMLSEDKRAEVRRRWIQKVMPQAARAPIPSRHASNQLARSTQDTQALRALDARAFTDSGHPTQATANRR